MRIHDVNLKGGQAYVYRLTLTSDVYVDRVYPLGGRRGSRLALSLTGQGLPKGPLTVALPVNGPPEYAHRIEVGGKRSNPFPLDLDDLPEILKDEKGAATGQRVTLPAVANGRLLRPGETDRWLFGARKGERYRFELKAEQLGSPLIAVLSIRDDKGKELCTPRVVREGKSIPPSSSPPPPTQPIPRRWPAVSAHLPVPTTLIGCG